ncbi:MAG: hypothetical protein ABWX94_03560, partial [Candidatus Saccharimonadales bacterium]
LTSRELHMWNVDRTGFVLDGTPNGRTQEVAPTPNKGLTLPGGLLIGGFILANLAVAYESSLRRGASKAVSKYKDLRSDYNEGMLYARESQNPARAKEVIDALYYDKNQNVVAADKRGQAQKDVKTPSVMVNRLRQYDPKTARDAIKARQTRGALNRQEKAILRQTAKTVRRLGKLTRVSQ